MRLTERLRPDGFTFVALARLNDATPGAISVPKLWLRAKRSLEGRSAVLLPDPLLLVFIGALGRDGGAVGKVAEAFSMLQRPIEVGSCNTLLGALANDCGPSEEGGSDAALTSVLEALQCLSAGLQDDNNDDSDGNDKDKKSNDDASGGNDSWDGRVSSLEAALGESSSLDGLAASVRVFLAMRATTAAAAAAARQRQPRQQRQEWPSPDVQTYTRMLSVLARAAGGSAACSSELSSAAALLLSDAVARLGQSRCAQSPALLNAAMRACGEYHNTEAALAVWRGPIKELLMATSAATAAAASKNKSGTSTAKSVDAARNRRRATAAAYHGLVHCMGLGGRPDLALRVVYAMKKSGVCDDLEAPATDQQSYYSSNNAAVALNVYRAASEKRRQAIEFQQQQLQQLRREGKGAALSPRLSRIAQQGNTGGEVNPLLAGFYEMQLEIECAVDEGLQEDRDRLPINKIRIRL